MPLPRKRFPVREMKAMPPRLGSSWGSWEWGRGAQPWAPQARLDFERLAGNLRNNAVVSICLSWLRRQMPQGQLRVGRLSADGVLEPIEGHPLTRLLARPNPIWSWTATLGGLADALAIDGNGYLLKARDGLDQVRELYYVPNAMIQVEYDPGPAAVHPVKRYWYGQGGVGQVRYAPRDVVHLRDGIDPERPAMGISDLKRQVRNIAGLNSGERYTEAVLRKGHAGKVLVPKEPISGGAAGDALTPDEAEMASEKLRMERSVTGENAGGIHATNLPMDLLNIGMGPEELALDRILDRPEAMVVASLGLNALVLGLPSSHDTRTFANYAEARRDAWESAVVPRQDLIADSLTQQLLYTFDETGRQVPEFAGHGDDLAVYWDRQGVQALREDANERATRAQALFTSLLLPRNRSLAEGGFDPVGVVEGELYYGASAESESESEPDDDEAAIDPEADAETDSADEESPDE